MATFDDSPRLKCRPHTPHDRVLYATAVLAPRSTRSPKGFPRSRTSRFNVARLPATPTRPSRGPWLAIGLCCPGGSSLTTASSAPLDSSPPLMDSRRRLLHPRYIGLGWESRGSPIYSAGLCSRAASHTPVVPKSASDCCFLLGLSLRRGVTGSTTTSGVSRLQSSFRAQFVLILRPASWLALLTRTFTFELAPAGSPRTGVEYDYVGKQSIPTTGLSPASPTALWAAGQSETFGAFFQRMSTGVPGPGRDLDMRRASPTRATIHEPRSTVHSPRPEILNNKRNSRLQFSGTPATGLLGRLGGQASSPISCCCNDMLSLDCRQEGTPNVPKSCRELQFFELFRASVHWCKRCGEARHQSRRTGRFVVCNPRRRSLLLPPQAVR